jgi:YfiH family protein
VVTPPPILRPDSLEDEPVVVGFSTLELGSVGLTKAPDPAAVHANRRHFAELLGLDPETLTIIGAVHGSEVARVDKPQDRVDDVDALITDTPGITLFATYADCYPIVLWDPDHRAAGLAHAGWRGTEAQVAAHTVQAMRKQFGSDPSHMKAAIGPGICGRCYEVGPEVAQKFHASFSTPKPPSKFLLDLAAANRAQLEAEGVSDITVVDLCTKETEYLPSHRREPDGTRFGTIVAIK